MRTSTKSALLFLFILVTVGAVVWGVDRFLNPPANQTLADQNQYELPAYLKVPIEEAVKPLIADLDESEESVQALLEEREQFHESNEGAFPSSEEIHLYADQLEQYHEFRIRDLKFYQENTPDQGQAKRKGEEFLEKYIGWNCGFRFVEEFTNQQMLELAQSAIDTGSADDTVHACHAVLLWLNGSPTEALSKMNDLADKGDQLVIAPNFLVMFRFWHFNLTQETYDSGGDLIQCRRMVIQDCVELLRSTHQSDHPRHFWLLVEGSYKFKYRDWKEMLQAILQHEDISLFHKHKTAGMYYVKLAWHHRGEDYALTVSEEGWKNFAEFSSKALRHFRRAWQLEPKIPETMVQLIQIANTGNDPDWSARDWFLETIHTEFDNRRAYNAYAWSLRPRWGGSLQQLTNFANECILCDQWQTPVPSYAFISIEAIREDLPNQNQLGNFFPIMQLIESLTVEYLKRSDNKDLWQPNRYQCGLLAGALVQAEKYELAKKLFDQTQETIRDADVQWMLRSRLDLETEVQLMTSDFSEEYQSYQKLVSEVNLETSQDQFLDLSKRLDEIESSVESTAVSRYVQGQRESLQHQQKYQTGDWVSLKFNETLSDWRVHADQTEIVNEETIILRSETHGRNLFIQPLARFSPPYEIQLTYEAMENSEKLPLPNRVGIVLGIGDNSFRYDQDFTEFGVTLNGLEASYMSSDVNNQNLEFFLLADRQNKSKLILEAWPERGLFYVDGKAVIHRNNMTMTHSHIVSFGTAFDSALNKRTVKLSDIRIRRLENDMPERLVAYYKNFVEHSPSSFHAHFGYGVHSYEMEDYEVALKELRIAETMNPNDKNTLNFLTFTYEALGQFKKAFEIREKNVARKPNDATFLNDLAWSLVVCQQADFRDPKRALELAQKACEISNHEQWHILGTLASAYAATGEFEKAVEFIEMAVPLAPSDRQEYLQARLKDYGDGKSIHE